MAALGPSAVGPGTTPAWAAAFKCQAFGRSAYRRTADGRLADGRLADGPAPIRRGAVKRVPFKWRAPPVLAAVFAHGPAGIADTSARGAQGLRATFCGTAAFARVALKQPAVLGRAGPAFGRAQLFGRAALRWLAGFVRAGAPFGHAALRWLPGFVRAGAAFGHAALRWLAGFGGPEAAFGRAPLFGAFWELAGSVGAGSAFGRAAVWEGAAFAWASLRQLAAFGRAPTFGLAPAFGHLVRLGRVPLRQPGALCGVAAVGRVGIRHA